jgi:uncharacterized membrane protein
MVNSQIDDETRTGQIILTPNASWSWQANLYLLYTLLAISLTVGIGFAAMGVWMILPYSILELSVLAICIYICVQKCNRQEVIRVEEHAVTVEKGIRRPSETFSYHRLWAKFVVKPPRHPWETETITIASHGKELELGGFLTRADKQLLIADLKRVVPAP